MTEPKRLSDWEKYIEGYDLKMGSLNDFIAEY